MNKRLILPLALVLVVLTLGVGLWVHFGGSHNDYTKALPADCRALVCMEPMKMMDEAGLSPDKVRALVKVKEAKGYGLDWERPMYFFYTASGRMGILVAVDDKDALEAALAEEKMEVTRQRGLQWVEVGSDAVMCFDDEKAMFLQMLSAQDKDQPRTELYDLMCQEGGGEMPFADALQSVEGSLRMAGEWQTLAPLMDKTGLPMAGMEDYNDVCLAAGCAVTERSLDLQMRLFDPNHRLDRLQKMADGLLRPVSGKRVKAASDRAILSLCANVDGARLLETMRKNAQLRTALAALNLCLDLDRLIEAIDGDVVLTALPAIDALPPSGEITSLEPKVALSAQMKNTDFMQKALTWGGMGMKVVRASADSCTLSWLGIDVRIGVGDGVCTVTNMPLDKARQITVGRGGEKVPDGSLLVCNVWPRMLNGLLDQSYGGLVPEHVRLVVRKEGADLRVTMAGSWSQVLECMTATDIQD